MILFQVSSNFKIPYSQENLYKQKIGSSCYHDEECKPSYSYCHPKTKLCVCKDEFTPAKGLCYPKGILFAPIRFLFSQMKL